MDMNGDNAPERRADGCGYPTAERHSLGDYKLSDAAGRFIHIAGNASVATHAVGLRATLRINKAVNWD